MRILQWNENVCGKQLSRNVSMEKAGATRELAAALAEAQREVFAEALDSTLATRTDVTKKAASRPICMTYAATWQNLIRKLPL